MAQDTESEVLADGRAKGVISAAIVMTPRLFSKNQIDRAGRKLLSGPDEEGWVTALELVDAWRSAHSVPLNAIQNHIRTHAKRVDPKPLIAQRLKRLSSIQGKLNRFPSMNLSRMQDIAGCRAIVRPVQSVKRVVSALTASQSKHRLVDIDNYVDYPKSSGYRGIHVIYEYQSTHLKYACYDGYRVEVQIRSRQQHLWATAVEVVETFTGEALKSSRGKAEWLRFFALMASAIALREKAPLVPGTPSSPSDLKRELVEVAEMLNAADQLLAFGGAAHVIMKGDVMPDARYFILKLDARTKKVTVSGYTRDQFDQAHRDYLELEVNLEVGVNCVLVSANSVRDLKRAYPNYFLETGVFAAIVRDITSPASTELDSTTASKTSSSGSDTPSPPPLPSDLSR